MFGRSPKLPVDLMLARTQPSKLRSYPQFVQDSHKQLTSSYTIAKQQLQAQHLRQKHMHDSSGSSEPFQIGLALYYKEVCIVLERPIHRH